MDINFIVLIGADPPPEEAEEEEEEPCHSILVYTLLFLCLFSPLLVFYFFQVKMGYTDSHPNLDWGIFPN